MTTNEFNNKVIERFSAEMTDKIFQYIIENNDLMDQYLDLVAEKGRKTVNAQLGKAIKVRFDVENLEEDDVTIKGNPKCVLIKTKYTKHEPKK